jgi:hypothetical protein
MLRANKESLPFLQEIVGESEKVFFVEDSDKVEMTLISGKDDAGAKFLADVIVDKLVFGIETHHDLSKEPANNLDPNPDERFPNGKPLRLYPPKGYDGYVNFNPDVRYQTFVGKKLVKPVAVLLHELVENYAKVHHGLQYAHAHSYAVNFERIFVGESRPDFTDGLAGENLEKVKGE